MAPICKFKMIETRCNMTSLLMWCQCWHQRTLMVSWIPPLYLFTQDDQNEMQHDFFSNWTLLALASPPCDANGTFLVIDAGVSVTWCLQYYQWDHSNFKIKIIKRRCNMTVLVMWNHWLQLQHQVITMASSMTPLHFFGQDIWNDMQHDISCHVMHVVLELASCDAYGTVNGTTAFSALDDQNKVQQDYWSCDATGTSISITLCNIMQMALWMTLLHL